MILHRLRVTNFKGIAERELVFPDRGVTLISGRNETGKTSMIDAFDLLIGFRHGSRHAKVRAAQPIGRDVGVQVEAEFTIDHDRVAVSRTWLKRPGTELRFVAGPRRGQQFTGDQAADLLEQLWAANDTALWGASRLLQATGLGQQTLDDSTCLAKALQAAAGGECLDVEANHDLVWLVRAEADRYFTASQRVPKGDYKHALDEVERTRNAKSAALSKLRDIEATRNLLEEVTAELSHQAETIRIASEECDELTDDKKQVERALAAQQQAGAALATARAAAQDARQRLAARNELVDKLRQTSDEIEWLEQARVEQNDLLEPINDKIEETEQQWLQADEQLAHSDAQWECARDDRDHLNRASELARLTNQLTRLAELRTQLAELEQAATSPLSAKLVEQISQASAASSQAQARLEVASAQLTLRPPSVGGELLVDGNALLLAGDQPWHHAVTDELQLELGGWQLEISPAADDAARVAADQARQRLSDLLAQAQVSDAADANKQWAVLTETRAQLAAARRARDEVLDGSDESALRDAAEQLGRQVADYEHQRSELDQALLVVLPTTMDQADAAVQTASDQRAVAKDALATLSATLKVLRGQRDERRAGVNQLNGQLGALRGQAETDEQVLLAAREVSADQQLIDAAEQAVAALEEAEQRVAECAERLRILDADRVLIEAADAQRNLEGLKQRLAASRERQCGLVGELNGMNADLVQREADQAASAFEQADRRAAAMSRKAKAALYLEQTLLAHQQSAQRSYVEPFRAAIAELGRATYSDPEFDVRVGCDLKIEARYLNGDWVDFDALSTGAKEQLVILIRLATAKLVNPDDRVPVLLDDALGYADQPRLRRMWSALGRAGEQSQVIVMTANPERYAGLPQLTSIEL